MIKTIENEGAPAVYVYISDIRWAMEPRIAPFNSEGAFIAAFSNREFAEFVAQSFNSNGKGTKSSIGLYDAEDFDIPVTSKIEAEIKQSEVLAAGIDCPEFRNSGVVAREIGYCLVELRQYADKLWSIYVRRAQKNEEDPPKAELFHNLLRALKRHRLMFLYAATAKHPGSCTGSSGTPPYVNQLDIPGWRAMIDDIDNEGEFLWKYASVLNSYAECAIRWYGPSAPRLKSGIGDEHREASPFWSLNPGMVQSLEDSVDQLLSSIHAAQPQINNDTACMLANVARPEGINRWDELFPIQWSYLGSLDIAIMVIHMCDMYLGTGSSSWDARSNQSSSSRSDAIAILFLQMAQAYYSMLEEILSLRAHSLDAHLNSQYLWLTSQMKKLLEGESSLASAGISFEPCLPDLLPTTIMDVDWLDMAQPAAESLIADIQQYLAQESITDPVDGSDDWIFLELFRPSIDECVSLSHDYAERMQAAWAESLRSYGERSVEQSSASEREPKCEPFVAPHASMESESELDGPSGLRVDASTFQLHYRGQVFQFANTKTFAMLEQLAVRPSMAVSVGTLIENLWKDGEYASKQAVQATATRLRRELVELKVTGLEIDGKSLKGYYGLKIS